MQNQTGAPAKPAESLDGVAAWATLGLLTFAYALAYIDRQLLSLVVDPIKHTLSITDTQFSLIQGSAFVVAYMAAAPIFGRLVDVAKRRNVLILGVTIWSICTALCGMASTFWELFFARVGVGLSEACIFPVAMSMISDCFSKQRSARAMSIFTLGTQIGGGFSLIAGGLVISFADDVTKALPIFNSLEKWQMAFIIVGLPGLVFALSLFAMPEPTRGRGGTEKVHHDKIPLKQSLRSMWDELDFYGRFYAAIGFTAIIQQGMPLWYPSILIRVKGMTLAETGLKLGLVSITVGTIGTLVGPTFAQWLNRLGYNDAAWRTGWISLGLLALVCLAIPYTAGPNSALVIAGGIVFFTALPLGAVIAEMQNVTPSHMRGVAGSLQTFAAQSIGYMIGPVLMAGMTDFVFKDTTKIDHSFQIVTCLFALAASYMFYTIGRPHRALVQLREAVV